MNQQHSHTEEQILRGTISRVTYRNPQNGYSVMKMGIENEKETITVVGNCLNVHVGSYVLVRGEYTQHPKFGRQFQASSVTATTPSTEEGLTRFLASGVLPGVGPKTAEKIVEEFGSEVLDVMYKTPERLTEIPGIGKKRAIAIGEKVREFNEIQEVVRFLIENNISTSLANRIYNHYGAKALKVITTDPYVLAYEMRGIGFRTADGIALNMGIEEDSLQRIRAGILYTLQRASDNGHCYLPELELEEHTRALLSLTPEIDLAEALESCKLEKRVVVFEERCFLRALFDAEADVAAFANKRARPYPYSLVSLEELQTGLMEAEGVLGFNLSVEQKHCVKTATEYPLLMITGGPGCGKTTVLRAITTVLDNANKTMLLAAPTGRAAQRMAAVTGLPASTIHRLLKYDPLKRQFVHNREEPLKADVLIIDESSMIDITLARSLFDAISESTSLILVGDRDQLPSVGPGKVFGDLVSLPCLKTVSMTQLFRRKAGSSINQIAHLVNSGEVPDIPEPDGATRTDAYFIERPDTESAAVTVENLVANQLPKKFGLAPEKIAVLSPSNRGPIGTIELNRRLQERLNPEADNPISITVGNTSFRLGDTVCQRVNNYKIDPFGVFNGDTGVINSIDTSEGSLTVELWDGRLVSYKSSDLRQLSLAYALTVHRSQGAEMPCVVLVLHPSHYTLLEKQLIYTGITRAKELLIVVGDRRALQIAVKRDGGARRNTMLRERIQRSVSQ